LPRIISSNPTCFSPRKCRFFTFRRKKFFWGIFFRLGFFPKSVFFLNTSPRTEPKIFLRIFLQGAFAGFLRIPFQTPLTLPAPNPNTDQDFEGHTQGSPPCLFPPRSLIPSSQHRCFKDLPRACGEIFCLG